MIKNIIKNVGDGIKGMVSWIKECGKAIVDGIKHSFSESTNVGVNLVKGLWNGINFKIHVSPGVLTQYEAVQLKNS